MRKSETQKLISVFLALSMLLSMLPMTVAAAESSGEGTEPEANTENQAVVYVSTSGNDANAGTENAPVATLAQAYALLEAAAPDKGEIVLLDTLTLSAEFVSPEHSFPVVIRGSSNAVGISSAYNISVHGPTTFENMLLECAADDLRYIAGYGNKLVMGERLNCTETKGNYFNLAGGARNENFVGDTDLTVMSGYWNNVYGASYNSSNSKYLNNTHTGNAKLTVTGGTIRTLTGGLFRGTMVGDAEILITGGEITGLADNDAGIYAASVRGTLDGSVTLTIAGEEADSVKIAGSIYGGIRTGTDYFVTGDVTVNVSGATVGGSITAESKVAAAIKGSKTVNLGTPLALGGSATANTFTGGGTLELGRKASLTVSGSVTGSTSFTATKPTNGRVYITAPAAAEDTAFQYIGSDGTMIISTGGTVKTWSAVSENTGLGLTLTAPEGVTLTLYTGLVVSSSEAISADLTTTEEGITTYFYEDLSAGNYCYQVVDNNANDGATYYKVKKNVYYSEENAKNGRAIDANPGKKIGEGFEQSMLSSYDTIRINSDEYMSKIFGKTWDDKYDALLTSPYFQRRAVITAEDSTNQDGIHQQTTHQEMMDFLEELDDADDNMYVYTVGETPKYAYPFQVVVFTLEDLSKATTLEEAAEILNANTKPTVQYQAEIHPTEPAATEGALVMAKELDGDYGGNVESGVLNTVDVVMIPRINADGAYQWRRTSPTTGDDMNRDYLYLNNKEVRMVVGVHNLFLPEVTIDAHEYQNKTENATGSVDDIQMTGGAGGLNNPKELSDLALTVMEAALNRAQSEEFGLRGDVYDGVTYGARAVVGTTYAGVRGGIAFLLETRGIHNGMAGIDRRVMAQYAAASTIINYTAEHAAEVKKTVADSRAEIAANGATYEETDRVVLRHRTGTKKQWAIKTYDLVSGEKLSDTTTTWAILDVDGRSRVRPTAYVIPKDLNTADRIIELLSLHTIKYYELEEGSAVELQQYMGDDTEATLTDESVVIFEQGAYVFPMNQVTATLLAVIMEPDVDDSADTKSTLYRMGLIEADSEGYLPIYRYCHDLVDGKISLADDYVISQMSATSDTNGLTFTGEFVCTNTERDEALVVAAAYHENGRMLSVKAQRITGETGPLALDLGKAALGAAEIRVFVVPSLADITPLSKKVTYQITK